MFKNYLSHRLLKFSGPFFWPSFHYYFCLGKKFYRMSSLSMKIAEKAFIPAAKWELCHWSCHTDIDAYIACISHTSELSGIGATARKNASHIAVNATINKLQCLINRIKLN